MGGGIKEGIGETSAGPIVVSQVEAAARNRVRASLRNSRPLKSPDLTRLQAENRKLNDVVLNQVLVISELKKEMNLD